MATKNDDGMLLSDAVNDFLSRNRRIILSAIAVVALVVVAITVYFSFASKKRTDDLAKTEEEEKPSSEILEKEDSAILELEKVGASAKGYASYLAFYNIADMYFSRKDYSKAKDYYLKAYNALPNNYVSGVLLFNVGVCIEEMKGELTEALEYYEKSSKIEDFPLKPRAMLNIGRLQEKLEKFDDAIATYTDLFEKYPENEFALIGKTRLIELNIKKAM